MGKGGKQKQKKKEIAMTDIQSKNPSSVFTADKETKEWENNIAIKTEIVNK